MKKNSTNKPQQIDKARKLLRGLPPKDTSKSSEETALVLEKDLRKVLECGYSPKEICTMLKQEGVTIPAYILKKFLHQKDENFDAKPVSKPDDSPPKTAPKKETEKPKSKEDYFITPDTPRGEL